MIIDKQKPYYIFSDESGNKMNISDAYYVVSWVFISPDEYSKLKDRISLYKESKKIKELKFNENTNYSFFKDIDFGIFITITDINYFNNRDFKILKKIESLNSNEGKIFSINQNKFDFKNKIVNSAKNSIFLYLFEYFHIENFLSYLSKFENIISITKDTPMYTDSEYRKVFKKAKETMGLNIDINLIKNSENFPGIELADIVAGSFRYSLKNSKKYPFREKLLGGRVIMKDLENVHYINLKSQIDNYISN